MAIANAFGANIFTILLALGLPCLIKSIFINPFNPVKMGIFLIYFLFLESESIVLTAFVLVCSLFIFIITVIISHLKVNRILGGFYVVLYIGLLIMVIIFHIYNISFITLN